MIRLLQVLMFMLNNPGEAFYGRQVAMRLGLPERSTYNHLDKLVEQGFLTKEQKNYRLDLELKKRLLQKIKLSMLN
jgi:DNA-binding IclR family transcriptional regulator